MGGKSTFNVAVLDSDARDDKSSFDLRSWQGLTGVLHAGKESLKDQQQYSDFRNLVLEYAQKGGDKEVKEKIDAIVRSFTTGIQKPSTTEVVSEVAENKQALNSFSSKAITDTSSHKIPAGRGRVVSKFVPRPVAKQSDPLKIPNNLPTHGDVILKDESPVSKDIEKITAEKLEPKIEPASRTINPVVAPPPPAKVEPEIKKETPHFSSMEEYKARITEIKRSVHERIGNPAALMDTHNGVGKKYMTALLTALKATGAGSPVGIETAMSALEEIYTTLLNDPVTEKKQNVIESPEPVIIETKEEKPIIEEAPTPAPVLKTILEKSAPVVKTAPEISKSISTPAVATTPLQSIPVKEVPEISVQSDSREHAEIKIPSPERTPVSYTPDNTLASKELDDKDSISSKVLEKNDVIAPVTKAQVLTTNNAVIKKETVPAVETNHTQSRSLHTPPTVESQKIEIHEEASTQEFIAKSETQSEKAKLTNLEVNRISDFIAPKKVADDVIAKQLSETTPVPMMRPKNEGVSQSKLFNPETTQALQNLLHEWPLFSGSGIFGIGPGGPEHPLYLKLATLSMGEVLSGRWEKADAKIIKTIKEYVNAWRHEQGIAYNIHETFEHYLRRVVDRIIQRRAGS